MASSLAWIVNVATQSRTANQWMLHWLQDPNHQEQGRDCILTDITWNPGRGEGEGTGRDAGTGET